MRMSPTCACCDPPECQHICHGSATITTESTTVYEATTLPAKWFGFFNGYLPFTNNTNRRGWLILGTTASGLAVIEFTIVGYVLKIAFGELIGSTFTVWGPTGDEYEIETRFFSYADMCVEFNGTTLQVFAGVSGFGINGCGEDNLAAWEHAALAGPVGAGVPAGAPIEFQAAWTIQESNEDNPNCGICNTCKALNLCSSLPPWQLTADVTFDGQCYPLTSATYQLNTGGRTGYCLWIPSQQPTPCVLICLYLTSWSVSQVLVNAAVHDFTGRVLLGQARAIIDRPADNEPLDCTTELDGLVLVPLDGVSGGSLWGTSFSITLSV